MSRLWRAGVLSVLLVGPILAYIAFGALWLQERGWLLYATMIWIVSGIVFGILAIALDEGRSEPILPPIDWDAPNTFSPFDRQAWTLVEEESERGDTISMETLSGFDIYIETGRKLARRLAEHYHPLSNDPIEHVPVVELLTALELAAEDLNHLCRQIPGGDLVTAAHWKRAVQAAGYIQKANDIYGYLLPIFNPVTGLARLGTQQWMVKPAWKNMQQNVLRWFYRAYVNRLGTHLIELYSGRLAIGVDQYRKLTRKSGGRAAPTAAEPTPLVVAVAGARDSEKGKLVELLKASWEGDTTLLKARLRSAGIDELALERLRTAKWVDVPGYTSSADGETARDRATRRDAIDDAVEADLLILVIKARTGPTPGRPRLRAGLGPLVRRAPRPRGPPGTGRPHRRGEPRTGRRLASSLRLVGGRRSSRVRRPRPHEQPPFRDTSDLHRVRRRGPGDVPPVRRDGAPLAGPRQARTPGGALGPDPPLPSPLSAIQGPPARRPGRAARATTLDQLEGWPQVAHPGR